LNKVTFLIFISFFHFFPAYAEEDLSSTIKEFEKKLPRFNIIDLESDETSTPIITKKRFDNPDQVVEWDKITNSGLARSSIKAGVPIVRLEDHKVLTVSKEIIVFHFNEGDENGFKYVITKDQSVKFKIDSRYLQNIKRELELNVPPSNYSEYDRESEKVFYDEKLSLNFETNIYAGYVQGNFFQDLLNQKENLSGQTTQIELGTTVKWKYIIRPGFVFNYDKTIYNLAENANGNYQSLSFGPIFKTQSLRYKKTNYVLDLQFRISPFSRFIINSSSDPKNFTFNSSDILFSTGFPTKNRFGEFTWGLFFYSQWLNFKNQSEYVNIRASNKSNIGWGIKLGQIF